MRQFLNIGSTPADEPCFPAGHPLARRECEIYKGQLEREFPEGNFRVKGFPHDFGTYYEVVAYFDDSETENDLTSQAAFAAEGGASPVWDIHAKRQLSILASLKPGEYDRPEPDLSVGDQGNHPAGIKAGVKPLS